MLMASVSTNFILYNIVISGHLAASTSRQSIFLLNLEASVVKSACASTTPQLHTGLTNCALVHDEQLLAAQIRSMASDDS